MVIFKRYLILGLVLFGGLLMMMFTLLGVARADPVPLPQFPQVFCFRITDIRTVAADAEGDQFRIEFEVLNWTDQDAYGVYLALNEGTGITFTMGSPGISGSGFTDIAGGSPYFIDGEVDGNGRPLLWEDIDGDMLFEGDVDDLEDSNNNGSLDVGEDLNGNGRLDNDPMPGNNANTFNNWTAPLSATITSMDWFAGNPIPYRDLIGAPTTADKCNLVPGCVVFGGVPRVDDIETIDDGNNVLDGFVILIDDFDPYETVSFNWYLMDEFGDAIGVEGGGNLYGFGSVNLVYTDPSDLPGGIFGGNSGFLRTGTSLFFDSVYNVPAQGTLLNRSAGMIPEAFAAEAGPSLTAAFVNPANNIFADPTVLELISVEVVSNQRYVEVGYILVLLVMLLGCVGYGVHLMRRRRGA